MADHKKKTKKNYEIFIQPDGFSERLRIAMMRRDVTAQELAYEIGVHKSVVYRCWTDQICIKISILKNICEVLQVSANWLLFGVGEWSLDTTCKDYS